MKKQIAILGLVGLLSSGGCYSFPKELSKEYETAMIKGVQESGQCIHKALASSKYLVEKDLPHKLTIGKRHKDDTFTHAWVEVYQGTNTFVLDPMFRWIYKNPRNKYFKF